MSADLEDTASGDGEDTEEEVLEIPNAADPIAITKAHQAASRKKDVAKEFWGNVLASAIGRQEIWRLLNELHTFEDRFAVGPNGFPQTEATWFQAGQQSFGLRFYQSLIVMNRDAVFKMHDEHDSRFAKPKRRRVQNDD